MNKVETREDQPNTKKPLIIGALIVTAVLAAIALITGFKLYELGLEKIIPQEEKEIFQEEVEEYPCRISFIVEATPSASPSPSPSASPSPSPSASPSPSPSASPSPSYGCWDQCNYSYQCPNNLECLEVNNVNRCVNPSCRQETDCTCSEYTPSPSPTPLIPGESPTPQQLPQELPEAGVLSPTLFFAIGGMILIGLGLLL